MKSNLEEMYELSVEQDVKANVLAGPASRGEPAPGVITDDAYYTFTKLLAYSGPPPVEDFARGITQFSAYIPWVRNVSEGVRILHPDLAQQEVYDTVLHYADWCRQRRD